MKTSRIIGYVSIAIAVVFFLLLTQTKVPEDTPGAELPAKTAEVAKKRWNLTIVLVVTVTALGFARLFIATKENAKRPVNPEAKP